MIVSVRENMSLRLPDGEERKLVLTDIPMFCINLQRRTDRWTKFVSHPGYKKLSGQIKRWNAVDGRTIDWLHDTNVSLLCKKNIKMKSRRSHEELESAGGVGCAYSHIQLWKWLAESQHDMCLIMEDDLILPIDFSEKVQFTFDNSPTIRKRDFDILSLGYIWAVCEKKDIITGDRYIRGMTHFTGFSCYLITRDCAKRLLEQCYPIMEHIDVWTGIFKSCYGLRLAHVNPQWLRLRTNESKTDIHVNGCTTCDIYPGFDKQNILMPYWDYYLMRGAEAIAGFGLCSWVYLMAKNRAL